MRARVAIAFTLGLFAASLGPGCTGANSIVGGECAAGYSACDGHCVSTASDPDHCGECQNRCEPGMGCVDSVCVLGSGGDGGFSRDGSTDGAPNDGSSDGAPNDGSTGDGSTGDGSTGDGSTGDGSTGDGGNGDGGDGGDGDGGNGDGGDGGGGCPAPPYDTAQNCGACGTRCTAPNSVCLEGPGGVLACGPPCTPPLVLCRNRCVDLDNDPFNCGRCGRFCPSNLCVGGECQGATPGDVVAIGHDYSAALANTSQARVLTNAVFIPASDPLRILSYEEFSEASTVTRVKAIVNGAANGRTVSYTVATTSAMLSDPALISKYDVVLLYDQQGGSSATLATRGAAWATPLMTFTKAGGVVVALDGNAGSGAMPTLLRSAGLLDLASHASIANGTTIRIIAPSDRVATLVASPYGTFARSVSFTSNEPNAGNVTYVGVQVVGNANGPPVVIHKSVP